MADSENLICVECESGDGELTKCSGSCARWFHDQCAGITESGSWTCPDCTFHVHRCFACKEYDYDNNLVACSLVECRRRFHIDADSGCQTASASADFVCARHACQAAECKFKGVDKSVALASCLRCSASYHLACLPGDVRLFNPEYFICGSHADEEDLPPVRHDILDFIRGASASPALDGGSSKILVAATAQQPASEQENNLPSQDAAEDAVDTMQYAAEGLVYVTFEELQALFRQEISLFDDPKESWQATPASEEQQLPVSLAEEASPYGEMGIHETSMIGPLVSVFVLHPADLLQNPAEQLAHLYPRFRCKVCDTRFQTQQNLMSHITEHRNLAMVLGTPPGQQSPETLRQQWFDQLRFKLPGLSTVGQVQDCSIDMKKPIGKHCRSWACTSP